jgi:putative ABC transport system permease protein
MGHGGAFGAVVAARFASRRSGGAVLTMHWRINHKALKGRISDAVRDIAFVSGGTTNAEVPLAWRNVLADKRRLLRSTSGIMFAALLMLLQLGFRGAFLDSALEIIHKIDGDIILTSPTKFRFGRKDPFSRRQLYAARAIAGVESARPIYAEWTNSIWKNPQTHKTYDIQVLSFDPDQPVFLFPEVAKHLPELRQPDTALYDRRTRPFLGFAPAGAVTELARRNIVIIGTFSLGPDFTTDGTLITSDRTFVKFFSPHVLAEGELPDVEFGVVKVRPGYTVAEVKGNLQRDLPPGIAVRTKDELLALEITFQNAVSPVGPIFLLGTAIGFIVGMMISYQILFTELSDQLPQYATLKAIGYDNAYLVRVVLEQATFYALCGFVPAWLIGALLYSIIGEIAILPLRMTLGIVFGTFALTLGMCVISAIFAVRRLLVADPAAVF